MPSDLSVYLANKTLKTLVGPDTMIDESTSAFDVLWGASGGSIATLLSSLEDVPKLKRAMARTNFVLSNCACCISSRFVRYAKHNPFPFIYSIIFL